jgi:hypothetical protein
MKNKNFFAFVSAYFEKIHKISAKIGKSNCKGSNFFLSQNNARRRKGNSFNFNNYSLRN